MRCAQTIDIPSLDDQVYEGPETRAVTLATPIGADLGAVTTHTVTVTENEAAPALSIDDVTVTEGPGATAVFTVSVSPVSAQPVTVAYQTANGTAIAGQDYTVTSGTLTMPAQAASGTIAVPILNDPLYEPTETFTVTLSSPGAPATIARATGQGTILDNPRVDIDPTLPGQYLADLHAGPTVADYLLIGNPHAVAVTARVTWVRADGTDVRREVSVGAQQRVTVFVGDEPGIAGQGEVSVAVQSLDAAHPLLAEHAAYWGPNWHAGRATEGVTPAATWYLAEGATTIVDEWIAVFNPTSAPVDVTFDFYGTSGTFTPHTERIPAGPGRFKVHVRDWLGSVDHGTTVTGRTLGGDPAGIVVERTLAWEWGRRSRRATARRASRASRRTRRLEGPNSIRGRQRPATCLAPFKASTPRARAGPASSVAGSARRALRRSPTCLAEFRGRRHGLLRDVLRAAQSGDDGCDGAAAVPARQRPDLHPGRQRARAAAG